jgi:hypothetical protein
VHHVFGVAEFREDVFHGLVKGGGTAVGNESVWRWLREAGLLKELLRNPASQTVPFAVLVFLVASERVHNLETRVTLCEFIQFPLKENVVFCLV